MKVALLGNPNTGKTTLFNQLTGLRQKVGNFPGVTVDKKTGVCKLDSKTTIEVIDLPGTYSLYPKSLDESVVLNTLLSPTTGDTPDLAVVIADASNLKRNLLLFSQLKDLGIPIVLALNLVDLAESRGLKIRLAKIQEVFGIQVVPINARTGKNITKLKNAIHQQITNTNSLNGHYLVNTAFFAPEIIPRIKEKFSLKNDYWAMQYAHQYQSFDFLSTEEKQEIAQLIQQYQFESVKLQSKETLARYEIIDDILQEIVEKKAEEVTRNSFSERLDKWLVHRVWGYFIFFALLFLIFQAIFAWATYPMDLIDMAFGSLQDWVKSTLPQGAFTNLLADGVIAGLGGIVIFIPQIAILFAFISVLEESGYMARVMFMMDKVMRKFGLNGKSVVPLISGIACAIPAIMATRNIDNWKERLITIMVTPLMSCSARLPVYAILIALVVPGHMILGVFNLQGFVLMGMYLLGFVMALVSAWIMKKILKTPEKSYLIMELPTYKIPRWKNVGYVVGEKVKTFVFEAGKIILAISIVLWVLSSYGPGNAMEQAKERAKREFRSDKSFKLEDKIDAYRLEASYAGQFGKLIEPIIKPLGYDWKIGIALITSFAAREVFVGTISTIYSIGSNDEDDLKTIKARMEAEINPKTGEKRYTPAVGFSLLVFYAFAMQCMSTLAIVYRETKGWKWTVIQFVYLTLLAYGSSWLVYQMMS